MNEESKLRRQVREFHDAFGHPNANTPNVPTDERVRLRLRMVAEEFCELLEACLGGDPELPSPPGFPDASKAARLGSLRGHVMACVEYLDVRVNLPEVADALGDMDYLNEGMRLEFGIDGGPVADEIHRSNMAKLGPDGKPIKRADGKALKPAGWTPPDIAGVLAAQVAA